MQGKDLLIGSITCGGIAVILGYSTKIDIATLTIIIINSITSICSFIAFFYVNRQEANK